MKNKTLQNALILMAITLISGFLLGFVNDLTKGPIEENRMKQILLANKAVFPAADTFVETAALTAAVKDQESILSKAGTDFGKVTINEVKEAYGAPAGSGISGEHLGYLVTVTSHEGYGGDITIVLGIDLEGTVLGIEFTAIDETVGFGAEAVNPEFKDQFAGKAVEKFAYTKSAVSADNEILAISGATKTTRAVTNAVNAGVYFVNTLNGEGGNE
ncbi:MAG: FMN-binding protein [Lachnospiraceae bacterium]|nr:FMN-binding protein [Lachnospiraceae bacterium]